MTLLDAILLIFLALGLLADLSGWPPNSTRIAVALTIVVVMIHLFLGH